MKEKLQEYALFAEIVSAIAIIASLIFVGYEIKQNSETQVQTNTQLVVGEWISSISLLSNDAELSCTYIKGISDFNSLSGQEKVMFSSYYLTHLYIVQEMYFLVLDNAMDDEIWSGYQETVIEVLQYPGVKQFWASRKHWFSIKFQKFVSEIMNQSYSSDLVFFTDKDCN